MHTGITSSGDNNICSSAFYSHESGIWGACVRNGLWEATREFPLPEAPPLTGTTPMASNCICHCPSKAYLGVPRRDVVQL
jgi:hypothetical protein